MPEDIIIPLAGMATGLILFLPIIRAGVRYAERKSMGKGSNTDELEDIREELHLLHDRFDQFEHSEDRISELEERVDFAERMLASHRDAPQVEGGK